MELNYKVYGQGEPLIILHGLFGSLDNWATHARYLADHFSVYLVDQRNHGNSPHHDTFDYPTLAEDLHHFMDHRGIIRAHLLGHSMGGKTVMQFATHYPERVDRLVIADMAPKTYSPHHTQIFEAMRSVAMETVGSRQEVADKLARLVPDRSVRQFLLKNVKRNGSGGFRWKFNLPVLFDTYENILLNIDPLVPFEGPSLFLYGGASSYVDSANFPQIREIFPAAEFVELPGIGHWLHAEAPEPFRAQLVRFLDK